MELPWWRRLGLAMLWVGVGALSIALVYKTTDQWLWAVLSLLCVVVGAALFMAGARVSTSETWPPD